MVVLRVRPGQHISFYQTSTLELIGKSFGTHFHSSGMLHIWTRAKLNPLALRVLTSPARCGPPQRVATARAWVPNRGGP